MVYFRLINASFQLSNDGELKPKASVIVMMWELCCPQINLLILATLLFNLTT